MEQLLIVEDDARHENVYSSCGSNRNLGNVDSSKRAYTVSN